jgi:hypothetical protein
MFGPLFVLKYKGKICPCLENAQERAARISLQLLSNLPILWLRDQDDAHQGTTTIAFVGKLFSSKSKTRGGIPSVLCWIDGEYGPIRQVQPQSSLNENENDDAPLQQSAGYIKTLSLNEIKTVERNNNHDQTITLSTMVGGKPKKLLVFSVISHDDDEECTSSSPTNITQALQCLVDWERERIPQQDRMMDDDSTEMMTMNRAQKAAHFCQRELELKRKKSERETRKQKYLNMSRKHGGGGGGMKYTAIAMANRDCASNGNLT